MQKKIANRLCKTLKRCLKYNVRFHYSKQCLKIKVSEQNLEYNLE